ncbi:hypothetical protein TELCIR_25820, partial [Teladorsagia circumcincta]
MGLVSRDHLSKLGAITSDEVKDEMKWTGMNFDIAAEEMRRLKKDPTDEEKLILYGLYKHSIHGNIPPQDIY